MRKAITFAVALSIAGAIAVFTVPLNAGDTEGGQATFVTQKCTTCHAVSSAGLEAKMKKGPMAGPDLTGVSERRDAAWITAYVNGEETIEDKKHARPFKGSDEELQTIVSWLGEQTAP